MITDNNKNTDESQSKRILVRNLPEGTLQKLKTMADSNIRSLEGEARYAIKLYVQKNASSLSQNQPNIESIQTPSTEAPINQPSTEIKVLRETESNLNSVIHSISRKLAGQSTSSSLELLDERKLELAEVERKLICLGQTPISKA